VNNTNLINNNQDSFYKDVSHADFLPALHAQQTPAISHATNVILCTDITQKPTNATKSHINHYAQLAFCTLAPVHAANAICRCAVCASIK